MSKVRRQYDLPISPIPSAAGPRSSRPTSLTSTSSPTTRRTTPRRTRTGPVPRLVRVLSIFPTQHVMSTLRASAATTLSRTTTRTTTTTTPPRLRTSRVRLRMPSHLVAAGRTSCKVLLRCSAVTALAPRFSARKRRLEDAPHLQHLHAHWRADQLPLAAPPGRDLRPPCRVADVQRHGAGRRALARRHLPLGGLAPAAR